MIDSSSGYGIGSTKKPTTPNAPAPAPTTTSTPFGTVGAIPAQIAGVGAPPGRSIMEIISPYLPSRGTPMRPVPPRGTPMRPVPTPNRGTPMRPVPEVPETPTQDTGYSSWYAKQAAEKLAAEEEAKKKAEEDRKAKEAADAELERRFSQLPALLPEQQQAYRQSVRNAQREFEMMRNQVQLARQGARRDFRQGTREVNREQTGQSTNLATALAFLGLDTSPVTMGVGLQDIERETDLARAELARVRAMTMGDLDAQMTQARITRNRQLSAAEQARLAARAQRATDLERYRMGLFE